MKRRMIYLAGALSACVLWASMASALDRDLWPGARARATQTAEESSSSTHTCVWVSTGKTKCVNKVRWVLYRRLCYATGGGTSSSTAFVTGYRWFPAGRCGERTIGNNPPIVSGSRPGPGLGGVSSGNVQPIAAAIPTPKVLRVVTKDP